MTGGTDESIAEAKKDSAFNMFCEIINNSSCTALYACRSRWRLCQLMRQSAGLDHYIFLSLSIYIYLFGLCRFGKSQKLLPSLGSLWIPLRRIDAIICSVPETYPDVFMVSGDAVFAHGCGR